MEPYPEPRPDLANIADSLRWCDAFDIINQAIEQAREEAADRRNSEAEREMARRLLTGLLLTNEGMVAAMPRYAAEQHARDMAEWERDRDEFQDAEARFSDPAFLKSLPMNEESA